MVALVLQTNPPFIWLPYFKVSPFWLWLHIKSEINRAMNSFPWTLISHREMIMNGGWHWSQKKCLINWKVTIMASLISSLVMEGQQTNMVLSLLDIVGLHNAWLSFLSYALSYFAHADILFPSISCFLFLCNRAKVT